MSPHTHILIGKLEHACLLPRRVCEIMWCRLPSAAWRSAHGHWDSYCCRMEGKQAPWLAPSLLPARPAPSVHPGGSGRWTQSSHAAKGRAHSEARVSSCHSPTPKRPGPSREWGCLWDRPGVGLLPFITPSGLYHVTLTGRRPTPWRPWACALSTGTCCCQVQREKHRQPAPNSL